MTRGLYDYSTCIAALNERDAFIAAALDEKDAAAEVANRLGNEIAEAQMYAEAFLCALVARHFPEAADSGWKPEETLMGLLLQIDNLTTGLVRDGGSK